MSRQIDWLLERGIANNEPELYAIAIDRLYNEEYKKQRMAEIAGQRKLSVTDREGIKLWLAYCTVSTPGPSTKLTDLYNNYAEYIENERPYNLEPLSPQGLGRHLSKMVGNQRRMDGRYYALTIRQNGTGSEEIEEATISVPLDL